MNDDIKLYNGDCMKLLQNVPDESVDMILCDLPYGTTDCDWDIPLPLNKLWREYKRVMKDSGAAVLFSQLPFAVDLINANRKWFRYEWIWDKRNAVGFLNANKMPLKQHENVLVFYKHLPTYNPQFTEGKPYVRGRNHDSNVYGSYAPTKTISDGRRFPNDLLSISNNRSKSQHPTQKPVPLCEYLIKTYTNEGEVVLDNCMGSGSTGVACVNTGRRFIGMELNKEFYETAAERIKKARMEAKINDGD